MAIASYLNSGHDEMAIQLYRVFCRTPIDPGLADWEDPHTIATDEQVEAAMRVPVQPAPYGQPAVPLPLPPQPQYGPPAGGPTWYEGEHDDCPIAVRHTHADVCAVCGLPIEPEARFWTKEGFPRHMLCEEPPLCGACGRFHAEGECDLEPVVFYEHPVDIYGTVFDPTDTTFGPIMRALQNGDFEQAAELVGFLAAGDDDGC